MYVKKFDSAWFPSLWYDGFCLSFIENYGTHIVTSATVGGRDVVYVRQHQSSPLSALDIESYVKDIEDQRFSDSKVNTSAGSLKYKDKVSEAAFSSLHQNNLCSSKLLFKEILLTNNFCSEGKYNLL